MVYKLKTFKVQYFCKVCVDDLAQLDQCQH